ncbi:MAG: cation-translocating P-type ATPase [Chitinophagales bacterium]|nr:cation-translocating P-type ATPase [Chitinophagales bacterium]MDW8418446.1 cation-translocating P-type ATPase [Chitinophagales bacterium]
MNWHCLPVEKIYELTGSHPHGLTASQAAMQLKKYGPNELEEKKKRPAWILFLHQFQDFMILILIAAAVLSGALGDLIDTIIIIGIIVLNALIGFVQEYRAEKAMEALKKMAVLYCEVLRDNTPLRIPASELVPGDIVLLEAGNAVPADIRLTEAHSLRIDESALTGESVAVDKNPAPLSQPDLPLGDRYNMAYKGTLITNGRGRGVAVATGMDTEIGKIARLLQEESAVTPLQKRMADFGKRLSYIVLLVCVLLFVAGIWRGEELLRMLMLSISLAVAAIPEALPALITVALALGARRMADLNALIRKLPAVETLGSVTFICSDKTGTLTVNKMQVTDTYTAPSAPAIRDDIHALNVAFALNHDVKISEDSTLIGDPTEIALVAYMLNLKGGETLRLLREHLPRVAEIPFDPERKCMTTIHAYRGRYLVLCKGAAESIAARLAAGEDIPRVHSLAQNWASQGLRVLAFAYKFLDKLPEPFNENTVEHNLLWAGLAGLIDPAREEVKPAVAECRSAGIKPVMITGDHPATATAIASQIGILQDGDIVIDGRTLDRMSEDEFASKVENISVYARVSPEQKLRIVKTLQAKKHYVAMTGDGVNDAPSLKAANIGVAMGITGTDVSKEAAHMILLDDNFATIVKAVREGRRIYDNIRKFVKYIMTCNSAEIWTIFMAPLLGLPIPLLPIHILWINLVTDGLPGIALANEREERDIMLRPPRKPDESLFADGIGLHIIWVGMLMAAVTLSTQTWAIYTGHAHWQTMVFTILAFAQLGHVLAIRSEREFLYSRGFMTNLPLLGSVLLTVLLQLCVIYWKPLNNIFRTEPLTAYELLTCVGAAVFVFHAIELEKWIKLRFFQIKESF